MSLKRAPREAEDAVSRPSMVLGQSPRATNNNNNNSHDNVYGAVIMTKVIARVHRVHLMNVH